ncbi:MAG: N-acetyltransferase [Deltaproteobacteria bacterium]|nr:N-acetyltransferase [Deltaproteobacteria bacterium]
MAIRPVRDDDIAAITAITNHYIVTSSVHFAYEPLAETEVEAQWRGYRDRFPWLAIEDAGQLAGYAKAGTWRDRAAYAWTAETGVYVAGTARRRGLGRAVYVALLEELARRGFRSAVAGITLPNDPSVALHLSLGFEPVGTVRDAGWKHGEWHDVGFWQKRFATDAAGPA